MIVAPVLLAALFAVFLWLGRGALVASEHPPAPLRPDSILRDAPTAAGWRLPRALVTARQRGIHYLVDKTDNPYLSGTLGLAVAVPLSYSPTRAAQEIP
jgi:hypothetical protein